MIGLKRILVPTDFSKTSEAAVTYAAELAKAFNASLHLLHVLERSSAASLEFPLQLEQEMEQAAEKRLGSILTDEQKAALRPGFAIVAGDPFLEIVRYAHANGMDLIVMGTHGRGLVGHMLMGSVAEKVVRKAPCPVLVVRHPQHHLLTAPPPPPYRAFPRRFSTSI